MTSDPYSVIQGDPTYKARPTSLEKKDLRYVKAHPDASIWEIARAIGHRPHYTSVALGQLQRLGLVMSGGYQPGRSDYETPWAATEETTP
jgi:hypothetical protein